MSLLELQVASPEPDLSVRRFSVRETINTLFGISVVFRTRSPSLDLEAIVGKPASFRAVAGYKHVLSNGERSWSGICNHIELVQVETNGLSTYALSIVPALWLLTQRNDYRVFQHMSIPDIVDEVLDRWFMPRVWEIDRGRYKKLNYKIQYDESDFRFIARLLEEAGISFVFTHGEEPGTKLLLSDRLHTGPARRSMPYLDHMTQAAEREFMTRVRISHDVRAGKVALRDHDFRRPSHELFGRAEGGSNEGRYEQYHYTPGGFIVEGGRGGGTPAADDRGVARHEDAEGQDRATRLLASRREGSKAISFETNAMDVTPGRILTMTGHPHRWLSDSERLLVTDFSASGTHDLDWHMSGRAVMASAEYRPAQVTPKPTVTSVQVATVVGPDDQEIHTDEFGRVRVSFHWDRLGKKDDSTSCWIRVSQGWAGKAYGHIALPRIGQEVIVAFIEGDPDQPIVVGRAYTAITPVPRKLPEHKTESIFRSDTSPGGLGASEVMFDDAKGNELVQWTAHKNMRRLIKNDYISTIGNNRTKDVSVDELDTTDGNRTEVTGGDRTETVRVNKTTSIGKIRRKLVVLDEYHTNQRDRRLTVVKYVDVMTNEHKRERVMGDVHQIVEGNRSELVRGKQSLTIEGDQHEKVGQNHALATKRKLTMRSGATLVGEAQDVTLQSRGGFIRLDATGVTISGIIVNINTGDAKPGKGGASNPADPSKAKQRVPEE